MEGVLREVLEEGIRESLGRVFLAVDAVSAAAAAAAGWDGVGVKRRVSRNLKETGKLILKAQHFATNTTTADPRQAKGHECGSSFLRSVKPEMTLTTRQIT